MSDSDLDRDWGGNHSFLSGTTKYEWVAHAILKETATFLCPVCLWSDEDDHDHTDELVELSEPELYIPKEFPEGFAPRESGQHRHRRRYCELAGHVTFGGKIANRSTKKFMDIIDMVLTQTEVHLREGEVEDLQKHAMRMKQDGRWDDMDIMRIILKEIDG